MVIEIARRPGTPRTVPSSLHQAPSMGGEAGGGVRAMSPSQRRARWLATAYETIARMGTILVITTTPAGPVNNACCTSDSHALRPHRERVSLLVSVGEVDSVFHVCR
jgi:hypothetical protein